MRYWLADDYDDEGNLKAPWWYWLVLLYQMKEWVILAAGMMANSVEVSNWIVTEGWPTLVPGFLALCCICLYPLRSHCCRIAKIAWCCLLIAGCVSLALNVVYGIQFWRDGVPQFLLQISLGCFSVTCLLSCLCSVRLHDVFLS
ncbi:DUF2919 family protein [Citrobacter braakii]